jgi:hypothetical protein
MLRVLERRVRDQMDLLLECRRELAVERQHHMFTGLLGLVAGALYSVWNMAWVSGLLFSFYLVVTMFYIRRDSRGGR